MRFSVTGLNDFLVQFIYCHIENFWKIEKKLTSLILFQTAEDFGGPRKDFFRLILSEIKEKYFDVGLRELLSEDYRIVGIIFDMEKLSCCVF